MASIARLVAESDYTTVLFDFASPTGAENSQWGSVPTSWAVGGAFDLGTPEFQVTRMEPDRAPGGLTTFVREGFATMSWLQRFGEATSVANLRTAVNRIATLFKQGGVMEIRPDGETESVFAVYEPSPAPALFNGTQMGLWQALRRFDTPEGITIALVRQPFVSLAELDSDLNKIHNSTMLAIGPDGTGPMFWTHDVLTNITNRSISVTEAVYQLDIATTGTRDFYTDTDTGTATSGDVWTHSFYGYAFAGTSARMRAVIRFLDSSGGVLGSESVSGQTTLTSVPQRLTVTSSAAPASTSKVRLYLRFENIDANSNTVRLFDAQCEKAASASRYRTGTERVYMATTTTGIGAPTTNLAGVDSGSGTGVPVGTRSYVYTFVTPAGESTQSPTSSPVTVAGSDNAVNLSSIDVGPAGTTDRKIYRRITGDTGNFKFVVAVGNNTATTISDNKSDGALGADVPTVDTTTAPFARCFPMRVVGAAETPITSDFISQSGATMHQVLVASRSDGGRAGGNRLVEHLNTTKCFQLSNGTLGTDTTAGGSGGFFGPLAQVNFSVADATALRVRKTVSTGIECLRGSWDVRVRCSPSADDHHLQLRWGPSLADPAPFSLTPVRADCRAGNPGTMEVPLGTITIPQEIPLAGMSFEVYAECDDGASGSIDLDCLLLTPTEEVSLLGKTIGSNAYVWVGSEFLSPVTNPGAGTAAGSGAGYKALNDTTDNLGSPPNGGLALTAGTWTARWTVTIVNPSNSGVSGNLGCDLVVRNITDSTNTLVQASAPFLFEGQSISFTGTRTFTAVAGKSYQLQGSGLDSNVIEARFTKMELYFTPTLSSAQSIHTDPGRAAVETVDASGNLLQPFYVAGPVPLRRPSGVSPSGTSVIHAVPYDLPASGAPFPTSTINRYCDVRTRYRPMFYT